MLDSDLNKSNKKTVVFLCRQILFPLAFIRRPISPTTTTFLLFSLCSSSAFNLQSRPTFQRETPHTIIITRPLLHKRIILFVSLSLVVTTYISCSSEISPTRCNNCVFILRNGFTLYVSGNNLTHHQEYICCIWPKVSRLT